MTHYQIFRRWCDGWQACGGIKAKDTDHALDLICARDKRFPRWLYKAEPIA